MANSKNKAAKKGARAKKASKSNRAAKPSARPAKHSSRNSPFGRGPNPERVKAILHGLDEAYPAATCALKHDNPFQLLISTILSAQSTDVRVNMVTPGLFKKYPTPAALAYANPRDIEAGNPLDRFLPQQDEIDPGRQQEDRRGIWRRSAAHDGANSRRFRASRERPRTWCWELDSELRRESLLIRTCSGFRGGWI